MALSGLRMRTKLRTPPPPPEPVLQLSGSFIDEGSPENTLIGFLTVLYPKQGSYVWSLTNSESGAFKVINGNRLVAGATPTDFETATTLTPTIQADNGVDAPLTFSPVITIGNVVETTLTLPDIGRQTRVGTKIGQLAAGSSISGTGSGDFTVDANGVIRISAAGQDSLDATYSMTLTGDPEGRTTLAFDTVANMITCDDVVSIAHLVAWCNRDTIARETDWTIMVRDGVTRSGAFLLGTITGNPYTTGNVTLQNFAGTLNDDNKDLMRSNVASYNRNAVASFIGGSVTIKCATQWAAKINTQLRTGIGPIVTEDLDFTAAPASDRWDRMTAPYTGNVGVISAVQPQGATDSQLFLNTGSTFEAIVRRCRFGTWNTLANWNRICPGIFADGNGRAVIEDNTFDGCWRPLYTNGHRMLSVRRNHLYRCADDVFNDYNQRPPEVRITATTTSSRVSLSGRASYISVTNSSSTVDARVAVGNSSVNATLSSTLVAKGTTVRITITTETHLAAITASGTATLNVGPQIVHFTDNTAHDWVPGTNQWTNAHSDGRQLAASALTDCDVIDKWNNILLATDSAEHATQGRFLQGSARSTDEVTEQNVTIATTFNNSHYDSRHASRIRHNTLWHHRFRLPGDEKRIGTGIPHSLGGSLRLNIGRGTGQVYENNILGGLTDLTSSVTHLSDPAAPTSFANGSGTFTASGNVYYREWITDVTTIFSNLDDIFELYAAPAEQVAFQPSSPVAERTWWRIKPASWPAVNASKATWDTWVQRNFSGVGAASGKGRTEW